MESFNNSQPCLTTEQRQEIYNIGKEFAFEPGLTYENYKRQFPEVPEEEEKAAFLEGFTEGKRISTAQQNNNDFNQGFGRSM